MGPLWAPYNMLIYNEVINRMTVADFGLELY